jgi:hypothetical protein
MMTVIDIVTENRFARVSLVRLLAYKKLRPIKCLTQTKNVKGKPPPAIPMNPSTERDGHLCTNCARIQRFQSIRVIFER